MNSEKSGVTMGRQQEIINFLIRLLHYVMGFGLGVLSLFAKDHLAVVGVESPTGRLGLTNLAPFPLYSATVNGAVRAGGCDFWAKCIWRRHKFNQLIKCVPTPLIYLLLDFHPATGYLRSFCR